MDRQWLQSILGTTTRKRVAVFLAAWVALTIVGALQDGVVPLWSAPMPG